MNKIIWLLILLSVSEYGFSGNIDLSLEINPSTVSIAQTQALETGEFSVTITNHGPDVAGAGSSLSYPISIDTEIIYYEEGMMGVAFQSNPDIVDDCLFFPFVIDPLPGNPAGFIYTFRTPAISAGESITCYGLYQVFSENPGGIKSIEWSPFSVTDNDVNPSNDISLMTFRGTTIPVPSLSTYALLSLISLILTIALFHPGSRHLGSQRT